APEPSPAAADSPPAAAAAPPPAPLPAPTPTIAASSTPLPFSLLLSSCRDKANAAAALPQFRRAGVSPHIVRTAVKGKGEWWRVMSGSYGSTEEAVQAKKALGFNDAVVVRTPFAALIGEYPSEKAAADAAAHASAKGVFPYFIPRPAGAVGLVAGAYLTQAEAESLQRELKTQGVATKIVRR
ncbi:MAG: SPOR domain-containing protein, partial [Desulfobacteraceae bacterium]